MNGKRALALLVTMALLLLGVHQVRGQQAEPQSPQGTYSYAFTYQGQLKDAGGPVNGTCDLRFILWDAAIGGSQVGSIVSLEGVEIEDGLFTARLDFGGPDVHNGSARWLEVAVRCPAGSGGYVTLDPRQELTGAPAALSLALPFYAEANIGGPLVSFQNSGDGEAAVFSSQQGYALFVESAGQDGLYVGAAGQDGVNVVSAGNRGLAVDTAGGDGVFVNTAHGNGVGVNSADQNGVQVDSAGGNGVYVNRAGNPSATQPWLPGGNGFEVAGAGANGLYVGRADNIGVYINSSNGAGVLVQSVTGAGFEVASASYDGVDVGSAGDDGVQVYHAGNPSTDLGSPQHNGFQVDGAEGCGLYVGRADLDGVHVSSTGSHGLDVDSAAADGVHVGTVDHYGYYVGAGLDGVYVNSAGETGVFVHSAGWNGVVVEEAGGDGVRATATVHNALYGDTANAQGEWGLYTPDKVHAQNVTLQTLTLVAQVSGPDALSPGDMVAAAGVAAPLPDSGAPLPLVRLASADRNGVVGVVEGRLALSPVPQPEGEEEEPRLELRSAEGPARSGDYVALTVLGLAQVKVDAGQGSIQPGTRLTSGTEGRARPLKTVVVEGVTLAENAPTIGIALAAPDEDGLVWVLVNPQ
jgi:hypothetical protein